MKLYEHQGKAILSKFGIPTPPGHVISDARELEALQSQLRLPVVLKAQVLTGGRGKAGGIQFAQTWDAAKKHAQNILGMTIKGLTVRALLVVEKVEFAQELYAAVMIDRETRESLMLVSAEGGVDIESVPDEKILRKGINPLAGMSGHTTRDLTRPLGLAPTVGKQVEGILRQLYAAYRAYDCELLEINPLAVTVDGRVLAGDTKAIINEGAVYRHPDLEPAAEEYTPLEQEARAQNIAFIQLPGRIGVIANGAGLTMATLDALNEYGGDAGVFLDLGGTDSPEQVTRAFRLMTKAQPRVVLINLFGGITKCDTVARGIRAVLDQEPVAFPMVARIKGTNAEAAAEILKDAGLHTAQSLQEAAKAAVELERAAMAPTPKGGRS